MRDATARLAARCAARAAAAALTLLIEPDARTRVEAAIVAAGGTLLPLRIDRKGVQVKAIAT